MTNSRKTLNFIIVGSGSELNIPPVLKYLQKEFRVFVKTQQLNLYDIDKISKAEHNPDILNKTNLISFPFRATDFTIKHFIGLSKTVRTDDIYNILFEQRIMSSHKEIPYYSKNGLLEAVDALYGQKDEVESILLEAESFSDFSLKFKCITNNQPYFIIEVEFNSSIIDNVNVYLDWFYSLVESLDDRYSDVFKSAYISFNYPMMKIIHNKVCRQYDATHLSDFILGTEWYVYAHKNIWRNHLKENPELFTVCEISNGCYYRANTNIWNFDEKARSKISYILKDVLIPGYSLLSWESLTDQAWSVNYLPKRIDVYYAVPTNSIVFSYNYDAEKLEKELGFKKENLIGSYYSKTQL